MKRTENGNGAGLLSSQMPGPVEPNSPIPGGENGGNTVPTSQNETTLYEKCVECPDYGVTCNGPKLAALGDIMVVRDFHREIRAKRSIPMKLIYVASQPISESTINDYFSHSEKDFKWTTVACIDNALTAICGGRVGQPLLDHPCPASSSEIKQQREEAAQRLEASETECQKLRVKLTEAKEKHIDQMNEFRQDQERRVTFLKDLAESRYQLILKRDRKINILLIIIAALFAGLSFYLVWDIMHPGVGLFQW